MSLADKTNFLRPQAQKGSSHRHVPDPCSASDLELPELPCAGATLEVTAKLLLVSGSQDFPPGKPHLWDVRESCSQICDELRRGLYETSRDNGAILKTTTRWQQNPGVQVRRTESHGRPHSCQERWVSVSLPHPHHSPHPPHTETHAPAPAESPDLFTVSSSRYGPLYFKYGKGQRFANLAANLNHKGSSVKSQGWSLISVKSESRGRGGRSQHFLLTKPHR